MKSIQIRPLSPLPAAALLLLLLLESCAPRPPLPAPSPPVGFKEWLPALQERAEHWQRYQARVHLKAQSAEKRFSLDAVILANLPDQFRLEAFRLGQTVGVLILNHGQSSLFVPSEKVLFRATRSEDLTNHLLGIALPLDGFGYTLSATVPAARLADFEIVPGQQEWLGFGKSAPEDWSSTWHFSSDPQALTSLKTHRDAWDYTIHYDPPVRLGVEQIPQKITFTSREWRIEAAVQELKPVETVPDAAFGNDYGREVRHIRVAP